MTRPIGVKSLNGSNGGRPVITNPYTMPSPLQPLTISVYPSAGERATASVAMVLPAPGRFSTMTACPRSSPIRSPTARVTRSGVLPGGKPTTIFTGLAGNCAAAGSAIAKPASAAPSMRE
jgi:hypothetical protein